MLAAALDYAAAGWRVFPCKAGTKQPATAHGFKDASSDPRIIRTWWHEGPYYNIGLDIPDDIVVLDFDPRNGAPDPGALHCPDTRRQRTPSGGWHLFYTLPVETVTKGQWKKGIDVKRGGRGYVLLAPSETENGKYEWWGRRDIHPLPPDILDDIEIQPNEMSLEFAEGEYGVARYFPFQKGSRYGLAVLRNQLQKLDEAENGERNSALNLVTYTISQFIVGGELREDALDDIKDLALLKGLGRIEAYNTMKSAWDAGSRKPRRAPK